MNAVQAIKQTAVFRENTLVIRYKLREEKHNRVIKKIYSVSNYPRCFIYIRHFVHSGDGRGGVGTRNR